MDQLWTRACLCSRASAVALALALASCAANIPAKEVPHASAVSSGTISDMNTGLVSDAALVSGTLDNGLRYFILPNATPPGQAALRVRFDAGSLAEADGTDGLAHYLEHMAFNGSENVPEGEMIQILERLGLSFGADTNASTGLEHTTYKLNLPKTTDEILDAAFMLMRETASNLTLDQDAIDRELGIILSEKRTRDSASYRAWEARMQFMTQGSDVIDRLPIGKESALRSIRSEDFRTYYDANYHPEKTIVAFVGDADPQEIERRIHDTFGDWTAQTDPAPKGLASPAAAEPGRVAVHAEDGLPTQITLMALRPYLDRPDTRETRNARTLRGLAFGILNDRLRILSESAGRPFISASGNSNTTLNLTEGATLTAYTRPDEWKRALSGIDTELRRALRYGFDPVELDTQIRRFDARYAALAEGADTRPTTARQGGLIDGLLGRVSDGDVFTHPRQELARWTALKETLSLEQVDAAFRERWGPIEDLSLFMQMPESERVSEHSVHAALAESRSMPVVAPDPIVIPEFAYSHHGEPGTIVSDRYLADVDARLVAFSNNVVLNVKQTDFQDDRVTVIVNFGDGSLSSPDRNEGLRRMALGVMKESGLKAHTPDELRRMMAGRIIDTDAFAVRDTSDSFTLAAQTVPEDMRRQLDIFAAQLSAQNFSEQARLNHIDKLKAWYPRHDMTVSGVISRDIKRLIYGDPRFGFDSEAQFYEPTLAEVEAWLRPELERGPIQVTIVGDIDPEAAVDAVAATLGALPDRRDINAPNTARVAQMRRVSFPQSGQDPVVFRHRGDVNQSQLRLYWPADDGLDPAFSRRLGVLRAILRNRLVTDIREGEATTYSPGAGSHASTVFDNFGYMLAVLSLKPEDIAAMSVKVRGIAAELASGKISADEFDRAIIPIVERIDSSEETNGYWLSVLADAQEDGLGLIRHRSRRADYQAMNVETIRALAKDVFDPDRALEVHILPVAQ